jgi:hypothetical protein
MPTSEFEKRRKQLIKSVRANITEEKEVKALIRMINKLAARKEAKVKKALEAKTPKVYLKKRVPAVISIQSANNVTHEEALQELTKMTTPCK